MSYISSLHAAYNKKFFNKLLYFRPENEIETIGFAPS